MKRRTIADSVRDALAGFAHALRHERNMRVHCGAALLVLGLAFIVRMDGVRFAVLSIVIGGVFLAELFNTAVEAAIDLVTEEFHPLAKVAKDVAAAAVLVQAVVAVVAGYALFRPYAPGFIAVLPFGFWSFLTVVGSGKDKEVPHDGPVRG